MVQQNSCILSVLTILNLVFGVKSDAIHVVTNTHSNQTEFVLLNRQSLALPNYHRSSSSRSSVKFSLHGANVLKIEQQNANDWKFKLDDNSVVNFEKKESDFITEYTFRWLGGGPNLERREVCFHYGFNNASWYNTYQSLAPSWPMNPQKYSPKRHFNYLLDFDYDPSRDEHMFILEHLFLNSDGFALMLDDQSPLFLRRDPNQGDPLLCISVNNTYPYMENNHSPEYLDIKFHLFAGKNTKSVHGIVTNKLGFVSKPVGIPSEQMFRTPTWSTWVQFNRNLSQTRVVEYARELKRYGLPNSTIELHRNWEQHYGDLSFDENRFPDSNKMISDLHQLGHRVSVWVYPDLHIDSPVYQKASKHFVKDQTGILPILINYSDGTGSYIDFSSQEASDWFVERLNHFQEETRIDAFHFNEAVLYDFSFLNVDPAVQKYPSLLTKQYADCAYKLGNKRIVLDSAFKSQYLPNFVNINPKNADWSKVNGLGSVIPTVLSLSMAGYSFIMPGIIGGGYSDSNPDEELYIRWVQASALMPAMKFSIPPWKFSDRVVNITKKFIDLHSKYAPKLIELARKRVRDGSPIIRPMWYVAPDDARSYSVDDQFMVGDDLLVAPVTVQGARERSIYLPPGLWIDQHGKSHQGSSRIKVEAPIHELPYFKRSI